MADRSFVFRLMMAVTATVLCWGCNDDVFIDEFLPEDRQVMVDGNGGSVSIPFEAGNWNVNGMTSHFDDFGYLFCRIFDLEGNELGHDFGIEGLGEMRFETSLLDFSVRRPSDDLLEINLHENMYEDPFTVKIMVGNSYETREIETVLMPSSRYQVDSIVYDMERFTYRDDVVEEMESFVMENSGDSPVSVTVYPYRKASRKIKFMPDIYDEDDFVIFGQSVPEVPVPDCSEGKPYIGDTETEFKPFRQDLPVGEDMKNISEEVTVDAYQSKRIRVFVDIEEYSVPYTLYLSNPGTGRSRVYTGVLESDRPYGYFILKSDMAGDKENK